MLVFNIRNYAHVEILVNLILDLQTKHFGPTNSECHASVERVRQCSPILWDHYKMIFSMEKYNKQMS